MILHAPHPAYNCAMGAQSLSRLLAFALLLSGASLPAMATEIWEIQGRGPESPLAGRRVETGPNVVTARTPRGFFMQTPTERSDGDPATSDGLYVYLGHEPAVREGDLVEVTGTVTEYYGLTELSGGPELTISGHGAALPQPVDFGPGLPSPADPPPERSLEPYEGMLVRIGTGTVTGPTDGSSTFWVVAQDSRAFREPGIPYPGQAGLPVWDGNPEVLRVDTGQRHVAPAHPETGAGAGLSIGELRGPLAFSWGAYEIWSLPGDYHIDGTVQVRPVREPNPRELSVATQNLQRLFDSEDDPATHDEVIPPAKLDERLGKISIWIREVLRSPTILALQEVENAGVLQDLADRIHRDGGPLYVPRLLEGNDPSGIDVGFLVDESFAVDALEQLQADERFDYGGTLYTLWDRPPLLLRGRFAGEGAGFPLVLIGVHLRSMNGLDGERAGFVREKRYRQALRLSQAIQQLQEDEPGIRLVVLGDFNAFEFTDGWVDILGQITGRPDPRGALLPVTDEVGPALTDQALSVPKETRYSFVREGNAEVLDHVLTTTGLDPWIRGAAFAHGNADSPDALADEAGSVLRCSDHDGLVLYLMTDANGNGIPDDREPRPPYHLSPRALPR